MSQVPATEPLVESSLSHILSFSDLVPHSGPSANANF